MLAAIIVLGLQQGTFDLVDSGRSSSGWIFLGFAAAFAVKAPLFPLHGWLPDAYRESPAEVSAVLSGVVSKAAAYGFLRIAIAKFPGPTHDYRVPILVLAGAGLVYGSVLAFRAPDVRGVVAYSSLAQLGLITFGLFAVNDLGLNGAVLQMVNHGLLSATLFLLAGAIERRTTTGDFARLGGMARGRPALATVLMTTGIIALAVPGSSAFAGEFLILAGVFRRGWGWAVVGAGAIVLAAMYMLRLISAVLHQRRGTAVSDAALDLRPAELGIVVPLIGCLLFLSAWPAAITDRAFAKNRPRSDVRGQFLAACAPAPTALIRKLERRASGVAMGGFQHVYVGCAPPKCAEPSPADLDRAISLMRQRVAKLGISEPEIRKQSSDQIVVELAGTCR
jgi:proton-translocating NADH-quinone oxidoreductase chain M